MSEIPKHRPETELAACTYHRHFQLVHLRLEPAHLDEELAALHRENAGPKTL